MDESTRLKIQASTEKLRLDLAKLDNLNINGTQVDEGLYHEIYNHFFSLQLDSKEKMLTNIALWADKYTRNYKNFDSDMLKRIREFNNVHLDNTRSELLDMTRRIESWGYNLKQATISLEQMSEKFHELTEKILPVQSQSKIHQNIVTKPIDSAVTYKSNDINDEVLKMFEERQMLLSNIVDQLDQEMTETKTMLEIAVANEAKTAKELNDTIEEYNQSMNIKNMELEELKNTKSLLETMIEAEKQRNLEINQKLESFMKKKSFQNDNSDSSVPTPSTSPRLFKSERGLPHFKPQAPASPIKLSEQSNVTSQPFFNVQGLKSKTKNSNLEAQLTQYYEILPINEENIQQASDIRGNNPTNSKIISKPPPIPKKPAATTINQVVNDTKNQITTSNPQNIVENEQIISNKEKQVIQNAEQTISDHTTTENVSSPIEATNILNNQNDTSNPPEIDHKITEKSVAATSDDQKSTKLPEMKYVIEISQEFSYQNEEKEERVEDNDKENRPTTSSSLPHEKVLNQENKSEENQESIVVEEPKIFNSQKFDFPVRTRELNGLTDEIPDITQQVEPVIAFNDGNIRVQKKLPEFTLISKLIFHHKIEKTEIPKTYKFSKEYNLIASCEPLRTKSFLNITAQSVVYENNPQFRKKLINETTSYFENKSSPVLLNLSKSIGENIITQNTQISNVQVFEPFGDASQVPRSPRSSRRSSKRSNQSDFEYRPYSVDEDIERIRSTRTILAKDVVTYDPVIQDTERFRELNKEFAAMCDEKSWRKNLGLTTPLTPSTRGTIMKQKRVQIKKIEETKFANY
ncbi:hypothetical protein TVAG_072310 [Trichomonas vaginalis G3]|uniref:Uncharacterized protein n=1 Tax=Trichomonas vaginalis (strain ATCC PRA-98 / G3) TaxID=412133 RepID=A2EUB5_TRIV3|nr:hypothetical protein TVAGG3_0372280 [Trichomonas vaginalis G3]EAY03739.1 hypothetical protein TVAG_072310 [Trichomonas vaginalis G3]KAI5532680.1 hypothetical protein TVAGG3_0372280 [Trichomonas vaginalis G3]|eukprot:XP_001315962.1 hypothetical protein [Trichomonas vaginalis G3]